MDVIVCLREIMFSSPFILFALLFLLFIMKHIKLISFRKLKNLPPGPPKWPIIGNLHQLGEKPHVTVTKFAKEYGPLISLHLGKQLLVVATSPEAAMGILKTQDRVLSSRIAPSAFNHASLLPYSLIWSECNERWKTLRTICRAEMFSNKAIESHSRLREEKVGDMLDFLRSKQGQMVNIGEVVYTTVFNSISGILFSKDLLDLKDENEACGGLKKSLEKVLEHLGKTDLSDFYPIFRSLDLQGISKGFTKHSKELFSIWEVMIKERRSQIASSTWSSEDARSFLDRLIENEFSDSQINQLLNELFIAGTDTTTTTLEWAMAELLRNKEARSKLEQELRKEINYDKITESQISKLSYLQACIKETLRLHAPGPFLIPHRAFQTCEVMGYTIPENTELFINIWGISRDPKIWDDPLSFKPERFLGANLDFISQDFKFIPFGAGRRMCPGLPSAIKSIELILATLIHGFNWVLPNGEDLTKLDMNDKFGKSETENGFLQNLDFGLYFIVEVSSKIWVSVPCRDLQQDLCSRAS
ncbi:cytochrome P450 [Cynara cardunculus var. scolymus]|uniref:Cytochrome P450 n=1 Tax=Cynara cardunculus var. scolymus TaxID=59895 RepID=A0A103Y901_CYNCS|nr:cytochrome P450 [Cynara cardunculus var. scolymus]